MAQEQEYKYPNICVPNPTCPERRDSHRTRTHTPSEGSASQHPPAWAALPLPGSKQTCCRSSSHPHRQDEPRRHILQELFGGEKLEWTGGKSKLTKALAMPGWEALPKTLCVRPPHPSSQAACRPRARRGPLAESSRWEPPGGVSRGVDSTGVGPLMQPGV